MRLLTWNILHGGGPKRLPEIVLSLVAHRPDVVVLSEFRSTRGSQIRGVLADHGLDHQLVSKAEPGRNRILVASRSELREITTSGAPATGRWLGCELVEHRLRLGAVHVPDDTQGVDKTTFWRFLLQQGRDWLGDRAIFLGDFNTSRRFQDGGPKRSRCEALLGSFLSLGYQDAWRELHPTDQEFSWFSHEGQGWRIDAAYLSPPLQKRLQTAVYSQLEREQGQSDHALLTVELDLSFDAGSDDDRRPASPMRAGLFGLPDSGETVRESA